MRDPRISPRAIDRLTDLNPTDAELEIIVAQVALLAKTPKVGYLLPFSDPRELRRYDVGRFGLIYKFNEALVEVVMVR